MTDEAAIASGAGDALTEDQVRAAQEAAEADALAPGEEQAAPVPVPDEVEPGTEQATADAPVAGSMDEVEAARSGAPVGAQEPPAPSGATDARLDALEARVAVLEAAPATPPA